MMRYHWGLGVGHTYAHQQKRSPPTPHNPYDLEDDCPDGDANGCGSPTRPAVHRGSPPSSDSCDSDDSSESVGDFEDRANESDDDDGTESDVEESLARIEMYDS
jgi:hypothetical protein